jgi:hypothetical protein
VSLVTLLGSFRYGILDRLNLFDGGRTIRALSQPDVSNFEKSLEFPETEVVIRQEIQQDAGDAVQVIYQNDELPNL